MKTISIGLLSFIGTYSADYGGMMAAIVIAISAPVAAYVFLQEKVESGLISGAIKG
jgi:raffinose/stachyose/melibiose transport system permease protein